NQLAQLGGGKRGGFMPAFWTVEVDRKKELEKTYILTSGDPERPEKDHEVGPGWPFAPAKLDFREGRIEAFSDWLTAPDNPLFARVAVNRLWQFPLRRLEAEPIWDGIQSAAGTLDLSLGGPSFDIGEGPKRAGGKRKRSELSPGSPSSSRRAAYMVRGYSTSRDATPNFLQA